MTEQTFNLEPRAERFLPRTTSVQSPDQRMWSAVQSRVRTTSDRASLPVPEFDLLPAHCLPSRIQALDIQQVEQLIGYERNHAERGEVLDMLERRRVELR